jgi:hypothetical protein
MLAPAVAPLAILFGAEEVRSPLLAPADGGQADGMRCPNQGAIVAQSDRCAELRHACPWHDHHPINGQPPDLRAPASHWLTASLATRRYRARLQTDPTQSCTQPFYSGLSGSRRPFGGGLRMVSWSKPYGTRARDAVSGLLASAPLSAAESKFLSLNGLHRPQMSLRRRHEAACPISRRPGRSQTSDMGGHVVGGPLRGPAAARSCTSKRSSRSQS